MGIRTTQTGTGDAFTPNHLAWQSPPFCQPFRLPSPLFRHSRSSENKSLAATATPATWAAARDCRSVSNSLWRLSAFGVAARVWHGYTALF